MSRGKVFLIDDDPSVRKGLDRLIRSGGYDVEALADAASFLEGPVPARPACLLLDIRMPEMSGIELQNAISGTPRALPVVFITGHGDEEVRAQALASGAVDVLFKPLDEATLFEAIDRALGRCAGNGHAGSGGGPPATMLD
jgi:FixJ family two-component response regulator